MASFNPPRVPFVDLWTQRSGLSWTKGRSQSNKPIGDTQHSESARESPSLHRHT